MIPQHSSLTNEHYTPAHIIEAAREVMGVIDLDPASCAEANKVVRANRYYTQEDSGLTQPWIARSVWLNPPGGKLKLSPSGVWEPVTNKGPGKSSAAVWWSRLERAFAGGAVQEAMFLCFSLSVFRTAQEVIEPFARAPFEFPFCVPRKRIKFTGGQPTHDNAIVYMGPNVSGFQRVFSSIGVVRI